MVHQHFKLVDTFTAIENIILGLKEKSSLKEALDKASTIALKYGFKIDLKKKIHNMSVSEKQTVEIIKVLYREVDILVLDEPTAVLTPQEIEKLFNIIRKMREDNKSIIIITHKLNEVMSISDRVSILRKGEYIGTLTTKDTNERELTNYMVGNKVDLKLERLKLTATKPTLFIIEAAFDLDTAYVITNIEVKQNAIFSNAIPNSLLLNPDKQIITEAAIDIIANKIAGIKAFELFFLGWLIVIYGAF